MPFSELGLIPALVRAAGEMGLATPTPVQRQAIPAILARSNLQCTAQTGSGKSAAFALPLLQLLQQGRQHTPRRARALVLVPTRELAAQLGEVLRGLGRYLPLPLKVAVLFGGVSINPQMMGLRGGADVLVATPGRLLDLVQQNALKLSSVGLLVLDEADRLLDLGFADELERVLLLLPGGAKPRLGAVLQQRQTLLFSATFPHAVQVLADALLSAPVRLELSGPDGAGAPAIVQRVIEVDTARRTELLRHLVQHQGWARVLVFVATKYAAAHVAAKLYRAGIFATDFHGDLSQGARKQVLAEFKDGRWEVVVTTDLAARGIDIARLPVVLNYDLPRSVLDYVHRIGRTGRAGEDGLAISFVSAGSDAHFRLIEKRQGLSLPRERIPGFEPADVPAVVDLAPVPGTGGVKGRHPSRKDRLRAAASAGLGATPTPLGAQSSPETT